MIKFVQNALVRNIRKPTNPRAKLAAFSLIISLTLRNENNTIIAYRERVKQCEALGEYAIAEDVREILRQEQEHQIDLATALGIDVPDVSKMKS